MRKFFKWLGIVILSLVLIIVILAFVMVSKYKKMAKVTYEVNLAHVEILSDSASLARGADIVNSVCIACHGGDMGGMEFFNVPALGVVPAPNVTPGGRPKNYSDDDYVRSIRYGVKPDGHGLFVMPVENFNQMSDADLGSVIGYLKTLPASDKTWPDAKFTLMAQIMAGAGLFGTLYNAELLDLSDNKPKTAPAPSTDPEYGKYTIRIHGCFSCHGENLNGNKTPDPDSPPGANITMNGNPGKWTYEQFVETLQSGKTPEGKELDNKYMPWAELGQMSDLELQAVYNYIKSIPGMDDDAYLAKYKEKNMK
ncbi:MAG: c-type cytochrome [Chitinophagales bacterium]